MDKRIIVRQKLIDWSWASLLILSPLLLLEIAVRLNYGDSSVILGPSRIVEVSDKFELTGILLVDALGTLWRTIVGFLLACFIGVILGVILGSKETLFRRIVPSINFIRNIPSALLVPILLILPGFKGGILSYVFVIAFGSLWPIAFSTMDGLRNIDPTTQACMSQFKLDWFERAKFYLLPSVAREVFSSMKVSLSISLILSITAEMLIGQPVNGLGRLMMEAGETANYAIRFFIPFFVALLGLILNTAFGRLENSFSWLVHRYENQERTY